MADPLYRTGAKGCQEAKTKAQKRLAVIAENPYQSAPHFEKLVGDLSGVYSRRINIQQRLIYQVL